MGAAKPAMALALGLLPILAPASLAADVNDDLRVVVQADPNRQDWNESAIISPDGRYVVAVGSATGTIVVWDVAGGNIIETVALPFKVADHALLTQLRLSPDSARISADAFVKRNAPFTCRQFRFTYTLASGMLHRDLVAATPPGKRQGLSPDEQAICQGKAVDPAAGDSASANASGNRVEVRSGVNSYSANPVPDNAIAVLDRDGNTTALLAKKIADQLFTAALSPDARYLAYVNTGDVVGVARGTSAYKQVLTTTVSVFDLTTASFLDPIVIKGDSDIFEPRLAWRGPTQLLLSWEHPPHLVSNLTAPPDAQLIDIGTGASTALPGRCLVIQLADGRLVGTGAGSCLNHPASQAILSIWAADTGWQPLDLPGLAGQTIHAVVPAADGRTLAVVTEGAGLRIVDLAARQIVASTPLTSENVFETPLAFLPDGRLVFATNNDQEDTSRNWIWQPSQGPPQPLGLRSEPQSIAMFSDGSTLLTAHGIDLSRIGLPGGGGQLGPARDLGLAGVIAGGFAQDGKLFWAASASDGVRFWDIANWSPAMSLYLLGQQHFFAKAPSGRYDTNLGPDTNAFRWRVADAPLQSLAPQTFMRDYFAPRLTARVLDGSEAAQPIPPILSLDRVLPQVQITHVARGPTRDTALVSVAVREGVDAHAANGKTRSGLYNLRLFRDNALIAQWPKTSAASTDMLTQWRADNALAPGADGAVRVQYLAHLPTAPDASTAQFSAYAFNTDRVKSDTATQAYTRPAMPPRARHAYVLTVGINAYHEPRLQLQFAANDAQLLAQRLSRLPGYDVRQVVLAGTAAAKPVTKSVIAAAADLLNGGDRPADLAILAKAGIDGSPFAKATPDDLVIIAFSGHGWADPQSNFFILPADAIWPDSAATPDRTSLISAAAITQMFRGIDAGAMALVIDACHSAASVATSGFKPGPMGDPGLGQLAYDKGIRILAATQSDDVAMEDAALQQGLLTYALAGEGIDSAGFGKADLNSDGRIMLDEWLRYALRRLPTLSSDERLRHFGNGFAGARHVTIISDTQALPPKPQDPALFDFNAAPSPIALREKTP